jgi:precorrin-2 dehydrogenase / sirohydrochlorin ferrochelatase
MLPIQLRTEGQLALVVGAGKVGLRKAKAWKRAGGDVLFVDPDPSLELDDEHICEEFAPHHLEDVFVVFACANESVNDAVVVTARANGILVCDAVRPERGDFTLPAVVRRGDLSFAVGTNGAAPSLAKALAERLDETFDEAYTIWTRILGAVRPAVMRVTDDPDARRDLYHALADFSWLERLRQIGPEATEAEMLQFIAHANGE